MWEGYPFYPLRRISRSPAGPAKCPTSLFSKAAPLAGGPFVTVPSTATDEGPRAALARKFRRAHLPPGYFPAIV